MDDVRRAQRGDRDALGRLIARHEDSVGRILWRFTRDQGEWESLVQDTFVEMIGSIRSYRADSGFEHWLARIATRVGYRHWTRRRRNRERVRPLCEDSIRALAARPEPSDAAQLLHELLGRIDPPERLALTLVYLEGLSLEESAARAGWSSGGMKMRMRRARIRLAQVAADCGLELGDLP
jgi:RNA polymerase sigma-70 factor (ECF subfamily)